MLQHSHHSLELARDLRQDLAASGLLPQFAKLYSQHTRLRSEQPALPSWTFEETSDRLHDALALIDASLVGRDVDDGGWVDGMRRAAEILEWLSHPNMAQQGVPTRLLAAAAYQLAGYPARSAALLDDFGPSGTAAEMLCSFLRAEFPKLLRLLSRYWSERMPAGEEQPLPERDETPGIQSPLSGNWIVDEIARVLGVLCCEMRWGPEARRGLAESRLGLLAGLFLHSEEAFAWLLARLCAETGTCYIESSFRRRARSLAGSLSDTGSVAMDRYMRWCYQHRRSIAWPSQRRGIERLEAGDSFVLSTPTGSGKTAVAEMAILQSLFADSEAMSDEHTRLAPMALYLVPTRALAAEVENKLSRVLQHIGSVQVTGLYGGTDWGPTDAWLTSDERTVLVCTYEKAEALIKFIGQLFVHRMSLLVIDEAHRVQYDGNEHALLTGESRPLRLESLTARLLARMADRRCRIIALSAVAAGMENQLASWVASRAESSPETTYYHSTRQLIGKLECLDSGDFRIEYDLLDAQELRFQEGSEAQTPYVPRPFPQRPAAPGFPVSGPEKYLRPFAFWAGMQLASPDASGRPRAVLIFVPQDIQYHARDFLDLLNDAWSDVQIPVFFSEPEDSANRDLLDTCLRSCEDYFGSESREYQLLRKGIILHHGKMPGRMARLLVELIDRRVVNLVLATSTLAEGLNLPFETVLIPTLRRGRDNISAREFANLAGRAGRPGFAVEGQTLVLLRPEPRRGSRGRVAEQVRRARRGYFDIIRSLAERSDALSVAQSPLARLIELLERSWQQMTDSQSRDGFLRWLEETAPLELRADEGTESAIESLDSLDSFLLSAIAEAEQVLTDDMSLAEMEGRLRTLWQRTYARYASQDESRLEEVVIRRGMALRERIYPDRAVRRRLYRTGLPPRAGNALLDLYPEFRTHLETGTDYVRRDRAGKLGYIRTAVELLRRLAHFRPEATTRNAPLWEDVLNWWLDRANAVMTPDIDHVSTWCKYADQNFIYRFNWGLGSMIALAVDEAHGGQLRETTIEEWPDTGLPWIAFWLKELVTWGTLDPVAAYLLGRDMAMTRDEAEERGLEYYAWQPSEEDPNEVLNAGSIRDWANDLQLSQPSSPPTGLPTHMAVRLLRDFAEAPDQRFRVIPVEQEDQIYWLDPAGYPLAVSRRPAYWHPGDYEQHIDDYDFVLFPTEARVSVSRFL